jgi:hypothetical protein
MPIIGSEGAASSKGFGQFAQSGAVNYIEDVFSTWLYTGNGSTQTITNGIDLAGKGGLVWIKDREVGAGHALFDTARGIYKLLQSNTTAAQLNDTTELTAFNSNGFSLSSSSTVNQPRRYASWTFRKQPKFFDVVTYTGNGSSSQTIAHSLGSQPGCIIVKRTDSTSDWGVWHRNSGGDSSITGWSLNSTSGFGSTVTGTAALFTSTSFRPYYIEDVNGIRNTNGATYVAYLFAHNAGGFGLTGTDNVISCGSYTGNGSATGPVISLGYEPQWVMIKRTDTTGNWQIFDTMRGLGVGTSDFELNANNTTVESAAGQYLDPTATGFEIKTTNAGFNQATGNYIYIAIRRGPMKVPTTGTSVFGLNARTGTGANATVTGSAGVSDAVLIKNRGSAVGDLFASRLTGTGYLETSSTAAEVAAGTTILQANPWDVMDGVKVGTTSTITNASANTYINYLFDRAPNFFDVVCYTGTGANRTVAHNLAAVPELMIVKQRSAGTGGWVVYSAASGATKYQYLNTTIASVTYTQTWNNTAPTASVFTVGTDLEVNNGSTAYIAYLFASCPGVSKVGSYTGTGATQTINCGFTGGARFVMIKRADSTGDWYVWDSARGIVAGNDPYLLLNSTAAEVTSTDYIDTASTGFEISSTAPAAINASGGTFIFLAIA